MHHQESRDYAAARSRTMPNACRIRNTRPIGSDAEYTGTTRRNADGGSFTPARPSRGKRLDWSGSRREWRLLFCDQEFALLSAVRRQRFEFDVAGAV